MKWFINLKVAAKLSLAFLIIGILLIFVGAFGLKNLSTINSDMQSTYYNTVIPISDLAQAQVSYQKVRVNVRDMMFVGNTKEEKTKFEQTIKDSKAEVDARIKKYEGTVLTEKEQSLLKDFHSAWKEYDVTLTEATKDAYAGDIEGYNQKASQFKTSGDKVESALKELIAFNTNTAEQSNIKANNLFNSATTTTITILAVSIVLCTLFAYWISRVISRPLNNVVGLVGKVANGDLTETTDIDSKDEVGLLAKSVNNMIVTLRGTVSNILTSAGSVAAAAQQISSSTEEIASGSTSQATAAQTMNELFRELSTAINSVATSAEEAAELSNRTMTAAKDGGVVVKSSIDGMKKVNEQMARLQEDSNKIGEIAAVIDDIAEQTNLLALNAAIEAARAGDQGRGFAVVADEVRKLAERSGEATKQITSIVKGMKENTEGSVKAVSEGVASTHKTGEAFGNIISMVNESGSKVTEIAAASEEQAAQSSEVMTSIESIAAVSEEAAAASQETAATSQSLAQLAEDLNNAVSVFKLK